MKGYTLPAVLWLYIPVGFILLQIVLEITLHREVLSPMLSEGGPHEAVQFFLASASCLIALKTVFDVKPLLLKGWMLCAALGCFYIAGEEVSWGQHIFGWITPEFWSNVNDQNETNLHNTSAWLDQKPRLLLYIGIVVGGLVIPAMRRWRPEKLPRKYEVLYPSAILAVPALGVLVPHLFQETLELFRLSFFERVSEVQELYIYYFIFLYLLDFRKRILQKN